MLLLLFIIPTLFLILSIAYCLLSSKAVDVYVDKLVVDQKTRFEATAFEQSCIKDPTNPNPNPNPSTTTTITTANDIAAATTTVITLNNDVVRPPPPPPPPKASSMMPLSANNNPIMPLPIGKTPTIITIAIAIAIAIITAVYHSNTTIFAYLKL